MADDDTPSEFIAGNGFSFNPEFLKREGYDNVSDISQLYPRKNRELWQKIGMPSEDAGVVQSDGKKPSPPSSLTKNGRQISWQHSNSDIVGYRIYKADKPSGPYKQIDHTRSDVYYTESNKAVYYYTAVNYSGLESDPSEEINNGDVTDKKEDKDKKKEKKKEKNKDKKKD